MKIVIDIMILDKTPAVCDEKNTCGDGYMWYIHSAFSLLADIDTMF